MSHQFKRFRSVKAEKVSELVAQQLKAAILSGDIAPGQKLPPERELENSLRRAVTPCEKPSKSSRSSGLITIKRGSGIYVTGSNADPVKESFSNLLRMQKITLNQLATARLVFEPGVARMA